MPYSKAQILEFLTLVEPVLLGTPIGTVLMFGPGDGKVNILLHHDNPDLVAKLQELVPADALEIEVRPGAEFRTL